MTRLQVKKVKKVMILLVQTTVNETSIITSKMTSFILDMEEETRLINLVQVVDRRAEEVNYVTA